MNYEDDQALRSLLFEIVYEDPQYVGRMLTIVSHETSLDASGPGMTNLSEWAADVLATHGGTTLDLTEVDRLTPGAARRLAKFQGSQLLLSGLTHLGAAEAAALADFKGILGLSGLQTLTPEVAESLAAHEGDLDLSGITALGQAAALQLARVRGWLYLEGVASISDQEAILLERHEGGLTLSGLAGVSPRVAELLVHACEGEELTLDAAAELAADTAAIIGKHAGSLILDGLTTMSGECASALVQHCDSLHLNGLTELDTEAAAALGTYSGYLRLNGLKILSDSASAALSRHRGSLSLNSLRSLSDEAARNLAVHRGPVSLLGLEAISEAAADVLRSQGGFDLPEVFFKPGHTQRRRALTLLESDEASDQATGLQLYEQLPLECRDDSYVLSAKAISHLTATAHHWLAGGPASWDNYRRYHRLVVAPRFQHTGRHFIDFASIPEGSLKMGSPDDESGRADDESQVGVRIDKSFAIGRTAITVEQWHAVMGTEPWRHIPVECFGAKQTAAACITWNDAVSFCNTLTQLHRHLGLLSRDQIYRLPTEAEWEYACRADTTTAFCFGDDPAELERYGWFRGNFSGLYSVPQVGVKKQNAWGLNDMHGCIEEWVADWYAPHLTGGIDPRGPLEGNERVCRGAFRGSDAHLCRSAARKHHQPDYLGEVGFRIVRTASCDESTTASRTRSDAN